MVIHPCAKYGKPMSNHKKVMGRTRISTDIQTDRQTEWFLYTPLNFVRGGYNKKIILFFAFSVYLFLSLTRIFHSFVKYMYTIVKWWWGLIKWIELNMETPPLSKGCKFIYTRRSWPMRIKSSLACKSSSAVTRDIHIICRAFAIGIVTTCFNDIGHNCLDSYTRPSGAKALTNCRIGAALIK